MADSLSFTLDLDASRLVAGVGRAIGAVQRLSGVASGVAGGFTAAFRGAVHVMHELNGAAQFVQAAFQKLSGPVKLAADVEAASARFRVMVGDAEKAARIFKQLQTLADVNPILDMADVAAGAASLAGAGMDPDEITDFLTHLGEAATDTEKFSRMIVASSQMLAKGGKVMASELMQMSEAGFAGLATEMKKVLGVTSEEFESLQQKGALTFETFRQAVENLTTGTGRFAGASAAAADTTLGKWQALQTTWEKLQRTIGAPIIDAISPLIADVEAHMANLEEAARSVGDALSFSIDFTAAAAAAKQLGDLIAITLGAASLQFGASLIDAASGFILFLAKGIDQVVASLGRMLVNLLPDWAPGKEKLTASLDTIDSDRDKLFENLTVSTKRNNPLRKKADEAIAVRNQLFDDISQGAESRRTARTERKKERAVAVDKNREFAPLDATGLVALENADTAGADEFDSIVNANAKKGPNRWPAVMQALSPPDATAADDFPSFGALPVPKPQPSPVPQEFRPAPDEPDPEIPGEMDFRPYIPGKRRIKGAVRPDTESFRGLGESRLSPDSSRASRRPAGDFLGLGESKLSPGVSRTNLGSRVDEFASNRPSRSKKAAREAAEEESRHSRGASAEAIIQEVKAIRADVNEMKKTFGNMQQR